MPNNVPPELEDKFKSCKEQVMAEGKSEDEAYAICYTSVVEGKGMESKPKPKPKSKARKHNPRRNASPFTPEDFIVAVAVPDTGPASVATPTLSQVITPTPVNPAPVVLLETPDTSEEDKAYALAWASGGESEVPDLPQPDEKDYEEAVPAIPSAIPISVTTFTDLDAAEALQAQADMANKLVDSFRVMQDNILYNPEVSNKGDALVRLARELRARLDTVLSGGLKQAKVGARHSKADSEALQSIHDGAVALGAMCGEGKSAFVVLKGLDGGARWLGVVSNNFRDLDGEIITEEAHKEFIAYLDKYPDKAPELWTWHTPGTARKSRADIWAYADGFLIMGGPLTPQEAKALEGLTLAIMPGMSHGFYRSKQGKEIIRYRTFEVSVLPQDKAANPWTEFSLITQEVGKMFEPEKRAVLVQAHGEQYVAQLEKSLGDASKALKQHDIDFKAAGTAHETQAETPTQTPTATTAQTGLTLEQVKEAINVDGLKTLLSGLAKQLETQASAIATLETTVKTLQKTDDEKVAEKVGGPRVAWGIRASEAKETLVGDEQARKDIASKEPRSDYDWLRQVG